MKNELEKIRNEIIDRLNLTINHIPIIEKALNDSFELGYQEGFKEPKSDEEVLDSKEIKEK